MWRICREYDCSWEVDWSTFSGDGYDYCELHNGGTCPDCETLIGRHDEYCSECIANHCRDRFCLKRIAKGEKYCANHVKGCPSTNCFRRISERESYCSSHQKACASCLVRVASNQNYCLGCQEYNRKREQKESLRVQARQQERVSEQNQLKSLVKANTSLNLPIEIEKFSTDWNQNLATVIDANNGYWVFLVVYDKQPNNSGAVKKEFFQPIRKVKIGVSIAEIGIVI